MTYIDEILQYNGISKDATLVEPSSTPMGQGYAFDIALTGFIYVYIEGLPQPVVEVARRELGKDAIFVNNALYLLARQTTLNTDVLDEVTYDGMIPIRVPGKIVNDPVFSIRFLDTQDLIISKIMRIWFNLVRPYIFSNDENIVEQSDFMIKPQVMKYAANLCIFATDETVSNITYSYVVGGFWPKSKPIEYLTEDVSNLQGYRFQQQFIGSLFFSDSYSDSIARDCLQDVYRLYNLNN